MSCGRSLYSVTIFVNMRLIHFLLYYSITEIEIYRQIQILTKQFLYFNCFRVVKFDEFNINSYSIQLQENLLLCIF